jgi:hypothetical protein
VCINDVRKNHKLNIVVDGCVKYTSMKSVMKGRNNKMRIERFELVTLRYGLKEFAELIGYPDSKIKRVDKTWDYTGEDGTQNDFVEITLEKTKLPQTEGTCESNTSPR